MLVHTFLSQKLLQGSSLDLHFHCFVKQNASCLYFEDRTTSHLSISAVSKNADLFYKLSVGYATSQKVLIDLHLLLNLKWHLVHSKKLKDVQVQSQSFVALLDFSLSISSSDLFYFCFNCCSDMSNRDMLIKGPWDAFNGLKVVI